MGLPESLSAEEAHALALVLEGAREGDVFFASPRPCSHFWSLALTVVLRFWSWLPVAVLV